MSKTIIHLSGTAQQVFRFIELVAKAHPDKTLGDLAR